jgi:hypothetical protein
VPKEHSWRGAKLETRRSRLKRLTIPLLVKGADDMNTRITKILVSVVTAVGACLALSGGAQGASPGWRQTDEYFGPAIGWDETLTGDWFGFCSFSEGLGCATFIPPSRARFVELDFDDKSGQAVHAYVHQGSNSSAPDDPEIGEICNATKKPLKLLNREEVWMIFFEGRCDDGTPSIVTTGTVTAEFSRRR